MTKPVIYPVVRTDLAAAGFSLLAWSRLSGKGDSWRGDLCGCSDDRCIGYHHDEWEECQCFPAMLSDALKARAAAGAPPHE